MLQKHAIRKINRKSYNSHTDPSNILKIHHLFEYQELPSMFDYLHKSLPIVQYHLIKCLLEIVNFPMYISIVNQIYFIFRPIRPSDFAYKLPIFTLPTLWNEWVKYFDDDMSRSLVKQFIKKCIV